MESKIKSWIYQDCFLKPEEEILYRKTENGCLDLTHIQQKMNDSVLCGFLQTTTNDKCKKNLYHKDLFNYYMLDIEACLILPA